MRKTWRSGCPRSARYARLDVLKAARYVSDTFELRHLRSFNVMQWRVPSELNAIPNRDPTANAGRP